MRLSGLPGVESSAVVSALPLEFGVNGTTRVTSGGHESHVYVEIRGASPDYFKTMQIPLVRGRGFQSSDTASAPLVAVVNEAFARKCCADGETLGSQEALPVGWEGGLRREIVGVVGDAKEHGISEPAPPTLFLPAAQLDDKLVRAVFSGSSWVVRSQAPLGENESEIRSHDGFVYDDTIARGAAVL